MDYDPTQKLERNINIMHFYRSITINFVLFRYTENYVQWVVDIGCISFYANRAPNRQTLKSV